MAGQPGRSPYGAYGACAECARLRQERAAARAVGDHARATACVALLRRHQAAIHLHTNPTP